MYTSRYTIVIAWYFNYRFLSLYLNIMVVNIMKSKDIAIVGILLAIGAILRYFLAMLHTPLTPNMLIAFYCLAIILIRPKLIEALGIGLVAGVLSMLISSSMFPPANIISEPIGALVCFVLYAALRERTKFAPTVTTFIATLASGFTFAAIAIIAIGATYLAKYHGDLMAFVVVFVPIVVITAVFNAIIVQFLYIPSSRVLLRGPE
jgi:hypothetical protein